MKRISFLLITLLIAGCSSQQSNSSNDSDSSQTAIDTMANGNADTDQYLSIHGKDIWVRDSSSTGPVIMKLNEGDRCTVSYRGKQETIKGSTGFWYKIAFGGKEGWLFGSQTSWRDRKEIVVDFECSYREQSAFNTESSAIGTTPDHAWQNFKKAKKALCSEPTDNREKQRFGFEVDKKNPNTFSVFDVHGAASAHYAFSLDTISNIWILALDCGDEGGYWDETLIGSLADDWELHGQIPGKLIDHMKLENGNLLFLFHYVYHGEFVGEETVSVWELLPSSLQFREKPYSSITAEPYSTRPDEPDIYSKIESGKLVNEDGRLAIVIKRFDGTEELHPL